MEMKKYKLGEIAEIIVGYPFESAKFNTDGKGVRLVRGMNVSERYLRFGDEARYWDYITDELKSYYLKENDIVIGMDGSKVGKNFALVKKEDLPLVLVQRVACIRAKYDYDQKFIWHYVSSKRFIEYVNTIKTGSAIPHISGNQISNFPIFVPDLQAQQKIAAVLSSLDDKIALNRRMNAKLEQMAKRLYDHWFVQFDFPNTDGKPYKASGGKMVWNETLKREIPERWEVKKLGEFAKYVDNTDSADMIVNYISTDNMLPNKAGISEVISKPLKGNFVRYEKFDVLISNIRPYFKKIWFSNLVGNCSTDVLCIRSNSKSDSFFIYRTLWKDEFFDYVMKGAKGSKMPRGDKTRIMNYSFVYPINNPEILKSFSSFFAPLQNIIWTNEKETQKLTSLRDNLLPLLMNGQVEVL